MPIKIVEWIDVKKKKPKCSRSKDALGISVLVWPPNGVGMVDIDGQAYYGRRAMGRPAFYKFGAEIYGVTHWMPMPEGPSE